MTLGDVGWAISGSTLNLDGSCGDEECLYQIAIDVVISVELTEDGAVVVEHFEENTERRSKLVLKKGSR
jgi:hypothetical protein